MNKKVLAWFALPTAMAAVMAGITMGFLQGSNPAEPRDLDETYRKRVRPLLEKYCFQCHSTKAHKGDLDLERFGSFSAVRKDLKPWQHLIEQVEAEEMPPRGKPRPTADERKMLLTWVRAMLAVEARARAGDPGRVPLRRLSNTEFDCTIRDLTGIDLGPAREFPADGAAGEGFTNAAEALSDITPALFSRYLAAAKDIADHVVLLPDGFRFSPSKTRRDWTDEGTLALRKFYNAFVSGDGKLPVQPYLLATVRHRNAMVAGKIVEIAGKEKLNAKYLRVLWQTLHDKTPSQPLDSIRAKWRTAKEKDVAALAVEVTAWQAVLWKTFKVGNYVRESWGAPPGSPKGYTENLTRQVPFDPPAVNSVPLRMAVKPAPGQSEVVLKLAIHEAGSPGAIVWHRPRFEAPGKPTLLLRDYADFGPVFELDYPSAFVETRKYLAAVAEAANDPKANLDDLAKRNGLNAAFLKQWAKVLGIETRKDPGKSVRIALPLTLLDDKTTPNNQRPAIRGWKKKGTDLPVVVANASDQVLHIPGRVSGWTVGVHPTPQEFVAVTWKSPIKGSVRVVARVAHAHPACGNGVEWWLEHRRGDSATLLGEGTLDLGKEARPPTESIKVEKGDILVLAVDPRDAEHSCDMTEIWLTVTETSKPNRAWDLGKDVSTDVQAGNPHADKHGNVGTWSFARGPAKQKGAKASLVPASSVLGRWRIVFADPGRKAETDKFAGEVEKMLTGSQPANPKDPNRILYDRLVAPESPLFAGVDVKKIARPRPKSMAFGLPKEKFAGPEADSLIVPGDKVVEIRLPAALLADRAFLVDVRLDGPVDQRLVRPLTSPDADRPWNGPVLASPDGAAYKKLVAGHAEFRKVFPLFLCFPQVVPTDEVVTLKMFHREDEPLIRLFLNEEQVKKLDRLWEDQRFISRQPAAEYAYLPQFMGFTTQDTPKEFQQFFIDRKPLFQKNAAEFLQWEEAAIPKQMEVLRAFTARAYRRPLPEKEIAGLQDLYQKFRNKGLGHDKAFRVVLARVLVSPAFLFRIEKAPPGKKAAPVGDWELASRLSYFLWSSMPDDELRRLAAAGKLRDPMVLRDQTLRMLRDPRLRTLAIEFGTQWIHVRNFDTLKEKNEKLFPTFTPALRKDIYEEAILFFQDFFQADRPITNLLDADYVFLNENLAKHYGIGGVAGPQWRRVDGVRKYGRGGILGLAGVHAKQSGASRTSPVLRGNWVVETLLGEKLPRPPANVPILPDQEGTDKLTTRQMVEKHVSNPSCAACHVRIDPYGFAFENFDAIGRRRVKEINGHPVDTRAKLKDGTEFEGIDGLRNHLLTKKKDVIVRLFCQKLLGYALGRRTTLSDTALIDEMVAELNKNDGRISAAVLTIVRRPQFRMIRGRDAALDD